jgi:hypothetical protein
VQFNGVTVFSATMAQLVVIFIGRREPDGRASSSNSLGRLRSRRKRHQLR